ncbi:MAG: flagellar basal body L-ring protein FlgH, partial [Kiloniellales bacterium]|nr:flagellar basal body L-ring protein FlgH [Kiloniellales bacterium]
MNTGSMVQRNHILIIVLNAVLALALISGCASYPTIQPVETQALQSRQITSPPTGDANAIPPDEMSLWSDDTIMVDLFSDTKARRIGDIVTIE